MHMLICQKIRINRKKGERSRRNGNIIAFEAFVSNYNHMGVGTHDGTFTLKFGKHPLNFGDQK